MTLATRTAGGGQTVALRGRKRPHCRASIQRREHEWYWRQRHQTWHFLNGPSGPVSGGTPATAAALERMWRHHRRNCSSSGPLTQWRPPTLRGAPPTAWRWARMKLRRCHPTAGIDRPPAVCQPNERLHLGTLRIRGSTCTLTRPTSKLLTNH